MPKPGRRGGGAKPGARAPKGRAKKPYETTRADDIYEAEDSDKEAAMEKSGRYDHVESYEYEMPSDFEDEDIDDEMAFTEEDKKMFGHLFDDEPPAAGGGSSGSEDEGSLLSSGEEEEGEGDEEDGWSDEEGEGGSGSEEEGAGARGRGRRRQPDELDELFGQGSSEEEGSELDEEDEQEQEEGEEDEAAHQAMLEAVTGGGAAAARKRRRVKEVVVTEAYPEAAYNLPAATGGELTVADLIAGLGDSKAKLGAARKTLERLEKKAAPVSAPLPGPIRQRQERKAGYDESKKEADKWVPIVKANREAPTIRFTADKSAVPRVTTTAALAAKHRPETDMEAEVAALLQKAGAHSAKAVAEAEEALAMKELTVEEARERQNRLAKMRALLFYHEAKAKRLKKIKSKEYRRKLKKSEKRKAEAGGGEGDEGEEALRLELEAAEFERAKERLTLKHKNTSRWARRALRRGQTLMDEGTRQAVAEQLRLGEELRQRVNRMKPSRGSDSDASTSASDDEGSSGDERAPRGGETFAGPQAGRGMGSKVKAAALEMLEGGTDAAPTKGLFALPFMQRALERKKLEAQQAAQQALGELEGGQREPAPAGGAAGRLAFTGTGVDQRAQWERVTRLEAAALNDDSDLASDEDEDAEAKAQRLARHLGLQRAEEAAEAGEEEAAAQQRQQDAGAAQHAAAAGVAAAAQAGRGSLAVTDGPISIDLPASSGKRRSGRGGAAAGVEAAAQQGQAQQAQAGKQQSGGLPHQDWLFGNGKAAGSKGSKKGGTAAAAGGVSVGPACGVAGERAQNGAPPPAQQAQQADGGAAPQPAFVKSKAFQGARPGYVFKKGPQGMGYYLDAAETTRATKAAKQRQRAEAAAARKAAAAAQQQQGADSDEEGHMRPVAAGLSQQDLIRRAFAGDDVAAEFAAAKAAEVEEELPQVEEELPQEDVPGMLPGWGTWAGQQREPQWVTDAKRKAAQRKQAAATARKDAKLQYVVISEKWDKKSSKYKTPSVPFPFDSKDTYERAMRQPLGREYNTDVSFRNLTRPAVLKDAGVVIEPIRFSKAMAQHDEQASGCCHLVDHLIRLRFERGHRWV
ncbi:U3 small nucleolar RNA-associated 14-like protein A [Chlorella sorokiniana]|uniref:U3 small nucleolar RNA-associated 14-like protein A n=1 Tax=Chlorella sorokiniana TaxID=3076 RepID=A0A2P6TNC6_CHLSO|nr:U3 small nucleolar RNA-associated 14-like protein A [Chlorella sorokiniana]|eukprot:PRW50835.1 U3 small nucleolar RNA-associated 14-like protein A [Chlorella sorokiniana]